MNNYQLYEKAKREWEREHPDATQFEYERAMQELAQRFGI
jgi:hypothetical protein